MADVAVEAVPPHTALSILEEAKGFSDASVFKTLASDNEYATLKKLQRHLEYVFLIFGTPAACQSEFPTAYLERRYIKLQEEYIKDEQRYTFPFRTVQQESRLWQDAYLHLRTGA